LFLLLENNKILLEDNSVKVKVHGSSYQAVKTKKYRGKKTIAPLDSYTISKKYGTYIDPIYDIKIFNESISLKPKRSNAKVKTVFNGKVIYAAKTAVLDYIVIIEHKRGLHTTYANLSQIAPNIKKGRKIKKGTTIGRIENELIFEVTQKSYHINPIRLFE
jgi:murein DD-endopeptidase MepM/ murein hydrolase activator NlpD